MWHSGENNSSSSKLSFQSNPNTLRSRQHSDETLCTFSGSWWSLPWHPCHYDLCHRYWFFHSQLSLVYRQQPESGSNSGLWRWKAATLPLRHCAAQFPFTGQWKATDVVVLEAADKHVPYLHDTQIWSVNVWLLDNESLDIKWHKICSKCTKFLVIYVNEQRLQSTWKNDQVWITFPMQYGWSRRQENITFSWPIHKAESWCCSSRVSLITAETRVQ